MKSAAAFLFVALFLASGDCHAKDYTLWDGKESIADYAKRNGLKERETIEVNGQTIEFRLVPAGTFVRGKDRPWHLAPFIFPVCFFIAWLGSEHVRRWLPRRVRLGVLLILLGTAVITGREMWKIMTWDTPINETPSQQVTISRPFYLAQREITVGQVDAVFGPEKLQKLVKEMYDPFASRPFFDNDPFRWSDEQNRKREAQNKMERILQDKANPVGMINWTDANDFCKLAGKAVSRRLRLPTEAEWQWTAIGNGASNVWHFEALNGGLSEWCRDAYMKGAYSVTSPIDPIVENDAPEKGWILQTSAPEIGRNKDTSAWTLTGFRPVLEID